MKKKDLANRKGKNEAELTKEIRELESRKEALQFDLAAGKVKNIREIRDVKKSVAQLRTLLGERGRLTPNT